MNRLSYKFEIIKILKKIVKFFRFTFVKIVYETRIISISSTVSFPSLPVLRGNEGNNQFGHAVS